MYIKWNARWGELYRRSIFPEYYQRNWTDPIKYLQYIINNPVDVSETFSADQHWFRIVSDLFQRCSLPENLSTAIIELWTALMSWPTSGPEFCVVWLLKMAASGWGSIWESSSFLPWLVLNAFRDVSGAVPEWPWISGLMRKSSR